MTARAGVFAAAACLLLGACATSLATTPNEAGVYADHLVGRLANLRQDYPAAADRYFAALRREPHNQTLVEGAAIASLASGDVERARQAARLAPGRGAPAYVYAIRGADDLAAGRNRQADDELEQAEGAATERLITRVMQVWARAAAGDVENVLDELTPLASIRPYGGLFGYQQAMALDHARRDREALSAYQSASEAGMFLPPAIERHADLLARSGRAGEALALLATEENRANPALAAARARLEAGEAASPRRLTPAEGAAIGLYGLAAIFHQEGDETNALATLTLALMLDPELDAARLMSAQIHTDLGHTELARVALARIAASSPYASTARMMEAWALIDEGRQDEALATAHAAAQQGDARARRALADIYRSLERYEEAEAIYTDLLTANPTEWRYYFARGAARERLGRWSEAEADFRAALHISPDQPDVLNYLGYTWADRGERLEEALAMIERAVELRPNSGAIIDSLGWAHYRLGNYAQALEHLERAVELEPADPTLNDHLGDVYWRLGRRIEARFQWQRALTLEPDDPAAIQSKIDRGLPDEPAARSATR